MHVYLTFGKGVKPAYREELIKVAAYMGQLLASRGLNGPELVKIHVSSEEEYEEAKRRGVEVLDGITLMPPHLVWYIRTSDAINVVIERVATVVVLSFLVESGVELDKNAKDFACNLVRKEFFKLMVVASKASWRHA